MSDLAEQIAREHPPQRLPNRGYVMCATCDTTLSLAGYAAHIATVTERAAREEVADDVPEQIARYVEATAEALNPSGYKAGITTAVRLIRRWRPEYTADRIEKEGS